MFFGGNKVVFTEIYKLFFRAGFFICLSLGLKVTQVALCVTIVVARSKSLAFFVYTFYATKDKPCALDIVCILWYLNKQ